MIVVAMLFVSAVNAQIRVAVLDFQAGAGISQNDVNGISDVLITYLGNDARFILVERTQVQRVLREQGFQHSTITDADAVRLGRILNVDKVILGRIIVVSGQHNIDCRAVNVQTGRIVATAGNSWTPATFRSVLRGVAQNLSSGMVRFEQARLAEQRQIENERIAAEQRQLAEQRQIQEEQRMAEQRRAETERLNSMSVVINGVRWARFNVGHQGTFVSREEEFGGYFTWEQAQTACPRGWRLPTQSELQSLNNINSIWITRNGVNGRLFGDVPNQIFFPAAGVHNTNADRLSGVGDFGNYRSGTHSCGYGAWRCLSLSSRGTFMSNNRWDGHSVRCVAEN